MNELKRKMELYCAAIEAEMRLVLGSNGAAPDLFYGMMHYHMGWVDEGLQPAAIYNGKKIRPILTLLCCEAAGGNWQAALPAAAALEILHNFTLIHDDIQDVSPTRRGRPTVWHVWGEAQAINTGDAMFASAQLAMGRLSTSGVEAEIVITALRRLNEMCIALTKGQFSDMQFEQREHVSVEEYLEMIAGKTSVLVALACELGALIGGANAETVAHYAQFGLEIGLAFQIMDDILGIWGDEKAIGKSAESDILTKKKSLPVLYGLNQSADLRDHYAKPATNSAYVQTAITLLNQCAARPYTEEKANHYSQNALEHLAAAHPQEPAAHSLHILTNQLLQRQS